MSHDPNRRKMFHDLPIEAIEEILSRVPVKSLVRLRCVCKSWCSLIGSPRFIRTTANNGKKLLLFRYFTPPTETQDYTLRCDYPAYDDEHDSFTCLFETDSVRFNVVGICNGLICLCSNPPEDGDYETIGIWNPAIKKSVTLPRPRIRVPMIALGFGFDLKENDFKVVRLASPRERGKATAPEIEVYSVRSRRWRRITNGWDPAYGVVEQLWSQVYVNGSVHWLGYSSADRSEGFHDNVTSMANGSNIFRVQGYKSKPKDGFHNVILSLDLATEMFRVIQIPQDLAAEFPLNFSIGLCGDSLALFAYDNRLNCQTCDVWVMRKYGAVDSWSRLFTVDADFGIWTIFGFTVGGEVLIATAGNEMVTFCPSNEPTYLGIFGLMGELYAGSFVETLALLDNHLLEDASGSDEEEEEEEEDGDGDGDGEDDDEEDDDDGDDDYEGDEFAYRQLVKIAGSIIGLRIIK